MFWLRRKNVLRQAKELAIKGRGVDHMMQLKNELNDLFMKEEKMWHQKSKSPLDYI